MSTNSGVIPQVERRSHSTANPAAALGEAIAVEVETLFRSVHLIAVRLGVVRPGEVGRDAAWDLFQDVVVRLLRHPERYDSTRSIHGWFCGFALNIVREKRREQRIEREHRVPDPPPGADGERWPDPLDLVEDLASRNRQRLLELLDLLPVAERYVLGLRFVERRDYAEIAEALGCKEGAARTRVHRAVRRLTRAYWQAEQFDPSSLSGRGNSLAEPNTPSAPGVTAERSREVP